MQNSTVLIVCLRVYGQKISTAWKKLARIYPQYPHVFPSLLWSRSCLITFSLQQSFAQSDASLQWLSRMYHNLHESLNWLQGKTNGSLPCTCEPKEKGFRLAKHKGKIIEHRSRIRKSFLCNLRRRQQEKKSRSEQNPVSRNEDADNSSMDEWKVAKVANLAQTLLDSCSVCCNENLSDRRRDRVNNPWNDIQPNIHSLPQPPNLRD